MKRSASAFVANAYDVISTFSSCFFLWILEQKDIILTMNMEKKYKRIRGIYFLTEKMKNVRSEHRFPDGFSMICFEMSILMPLTLTAICSVMVCNQSQMTESWQNQLWVSVTEKSTTIIVWDEAWAVFCDWLTTIDSIDCIQRDWSLKLIVYISYDLEKLLDSKGVTYLCTYQTQETLFHHIFKHREES